MTPELTALVERLERMMSLNHNGAEWLRDDTIATIRALAGEVEEWKQLDALRCEELFGLREDHGNALIERDTLREQVAEARALQREYRSAKLLAENDAAMVRAVWTDIQPKLEVEVAHWKQVDSLRCEELAHTQADRDELSREVERVKEWRAAEAADAAAERDTLRAEVERLKSQVACLEMNLHHEQDGRGQR